MCGSSHFLLFSRLCWLFEALCIRIRLTISAKESWLRLGRDWAESEDRLGEGVRAVFGCFVVSDSVWLCGLYPTRLSVQGILQARIPEWLPCPPPGDLPNPGVEPESPALQADYLPIEPPVKSYCHLNSILVHGHILESFDSLELWRHVSNVNLPTWQRSGRVTLICLVRVLGSELVGWGPLVYTHFSGLLTSVGWSRTSKSPDNFSSSMTTDFFSSLSQVWSRFLQLAWRSTGRLFIIFGVMCLPHGNEVIYPSFGM